MNQLQPQTRDRLFAGAAALVAIIIGYQIAQGRIILPIVIVAATCLLVINKVQTLPLQIVIVCGLLAGYLVANRGFAQLMPVPSLPLLPGEAALAMLITIQVLNRVASKQPCRVLLALDWAIGIFLVIGCVRFAFDVREFKILAVRDFAMVYYTGFFYLACNLAHHREDVLRLALATIRVSSLIMLPLYLAAERFPDLFLGQLSFRGVPLIFFKDDLVGAYCGLGAVLHFFHAEERHTIFNRVACLVLAGGIVLTNNRAAMLGLTIAVVWAMLGKRWRLPLWLGIGGVIATITLIISAQVKNQTWQDTPLLEFYERVVSVFDPTGQGSYRGQMTESKGENNLFRTVWWTSVYHETVDKNPVFGLGFGHDLARSFLEQYYADVPDDFTARSPHSIFVSVFGRMGLAGLLSFMAICGFLATFTWRQRNQNVAVFGTSCAAWVLLASSCFGVVLEGPMGAIPFWILVGLAQGESERLKNAPPFEPPALTETTVP